MAESKRGRGNPGPHHSEYSSKLSIFVRRFSGMFNVESNNGWTQFMKTVLSSNAYSRFLFCILVADVVRIIIEADMIISSEYVAQHPSYFYTHTIFLICLAVYFLDLFIRISAQMKGFFSSVWNLLDLFVFCDYIAVFVIYCTFPYFSTYVGLRLLRGFQILKIFKFISIIPSLELVVNALLYTMTTAVMDVLVLTLMAVFILGVFGYYMFGTSNLTSPAYAHWSTLPNSFYSVWVFICGDNWLPYQDELRNSGYPVSQLFSILLIFVGNFIIFNSFIGVISQNVYEASQAERIRILMQQKEAKLKKKELFLKKQQKDIMQLMEQTSNTGAGFQEIIRGLAGTLRHDDRLLVKQLPMNLVWLEAFVLGLHYHEYAMFKCQQAHFAIAHSLAEVVDRRLQNKDV